MLLLIDAGNTRIKWALVDPRCPLNASATVDQSGQQGYVGWLASGAVLHADAATLAAVWRCAVAAFSTASTRLVSVVIANVAGKAMQQLLMQTLHEALQLERPALSWFASVPSLAGLRNGYRDPVQLGCDRFASMIGARALFPTQALIVVTCGTATTIDAVSAEGDFLGGMILPGLALMATSLAKNTAQLPQIGAAFTPPTLFADHTDAAILSGCLNAQAGAIERAVRAHDGVRCLLSGGAARFVAPALSIPCNLVDNLVLLGLQAAHLPTSPSLC